MSGPPGWPGTDWRAIPEEASDTVTATASAALHGLLDTAGPPPAAGDTLPPLWHWLAFLPDAPQRDLGPDGHPKLGRFLPPVALPRRMFAAGRFEFHAPTAVGELLRRHSRVSAITNKSGRSGELVFVEVTHTLYTDAGPATTEVQDLVYRDAAAAATGAQPRPPADDIDWSWHLELATDPTMLFRFSALTYNAHRIHYDRPYATDVEGYPGLVVQGPLQATALAEVCRRSVPDRSLRSFRFRALRPAFDGTPLHLRGRPTGGDEVELVAFDSSGYPTMRAEATLAPING